MMSSLIAAIFIVTAIYSIIYLKFLQDMIKIVITGVSSSFLLSLLPSLPHTSTVHWYQPYPSNPVKPHPLRADL